MSESNNTHTQSPRETRDIPPDIARALVDLRLERQEDINERARELHISPAELTELLKHPTDDRARRILALRPTDSRESQETSVRALEMVMLTLPAFLMARIAPEVLAKTDSLRLLASIPVSDITGKQNMSPLQKIAWNKLQSIAQDQESPLYSFFSTEWEKTVKGFAPVAQSTSDFLGNNVSSGNGIMDTIKNNPGTSALVLLWWGLILWRIFSSSDEKWSSETWWEKSILDKIADYLPGKWMLWGIGIIIALLWIGSLIWWEDILKKVWIDTDTVKKLSDIYNDSSLSLLDKAQRFMATIRGKEFQDTASPEWVGIARLYQSYHGFLAPYVSLTAEKRKWLTYQTKRFSERDGLGYEAAKAELPTLKTQYDEILTSPEKSIAEAERRIVSEVSNGIHPGYGNIDEGIRTLSDEQAKLLGIDKSNPTAARQMYYRYLALDEVSHLQKSLVYHIAAIEGGPTNYSNFMKLKWDPAYYYAQIQAIEVERRSQLTRLAWAERLDDARDIEAFRQLAKKFDAIVLEKDKQVQTLANEIGVLSQKYNILPEWSAERIQIEWEVQKRLKLVADIEDQVAEIGDKFFRENNKEFIKLMKLAKFDTTGIYKLKNFFPALAAEAFGKTYYGKGINATDFSTWTKTRFFRLWSLKGWVAIMGLWAGLALYNGQDVSKTLWRIAVGFIPYVWTGFDTKDLYDSIMRGDGMEILINAGALTLSVWGDVLFTLWMLSLIWSGIWAWLKGGLAELRAALKAWLQVMEVTGVKEALENGWNITMHLSNGTTRVVTVTAEEGTRIARMNEALWPYRDIIAKTTKYGMVTGATAMIWGAGVAISTAYLDKSWENIKTQKVTTKA